MPLDRPIIIGTRDSQLAMWQANRVQEALEELGYHTQLHPVKSQGDLNLKDPLYEMGITGIFTKTLDIAQVNGQIDIAVHSLKDVPTQLPKGMVQGAVLARASMKDILVYKPSFNPDEHMKIATGSLRRKSQWLHHYPLHEITDLRGNVNTRLAKLQSNQDWNGAIFAKAGLQRIGILDHLKSSYGFEYTDLDSFIPAPAQGAMMVTVMKNNQEVLAAVQRLNDTSTQLCVDIERRFLNLLEGGCTAPIGAYAYIKENTLYFEGALFALDGGLRIDAAGQAPVEELTRDGGLAFAKAQSNAILQNGGRELMKAIKAAIES